MAETPGSGKVRCRRAGARDRSPPVSTLLEGVLQEVDRTIVGLLERIRREGPPPRALLDVGCWDGSATERHARALGCPAFGIEFFEARAREAEARGVTVARLDLESAAFPWPDGSMDVVVSNQVFEHLKNVWQPMAEIHRVLKPRGWALLSVPNLASFHNRVMLALGWQPTSIRTFGPHVRGFTRREFERFVRFRDGFAITKSLGVGFHPFPMPWSRPLAGLWPGGSHTLVVVARKTAGTGSPWGEHLARETAQEVQTFYR